MGEGKEGQGSCLTVTIVGVHVEIWNLPAMDAGICPTTVTVFTVAAHGYCQHGAPGRYKGGEMKSSVLAPSSAPSLGP